MKAIADKTMPVAGAPRSLDTNGRKPRKPGKRRAEIRGGWVYLICWLVILGFVAIGVLTVSWM